LILIYFSQHSRARVWRNSHGLHDLLSRGKFPTYRILCLNSPLTLEQFWKRRSAELALKWGVLDYTHKEPDRAEFEGDGKAWNYFNSQLQDFYSARDRKRFQMFSLPSVFIVLVVAFIILLSMLSWKYVTFLVSPNQEKDPYGSWKTFVVPLIMTVVILILSNVYKSLAVYLNDRENHRTVSDYENALIFKIFLFEFFNNFTPLFFTAWAIRDMYQLYFTLLIQLAVKQFVTNAISYLTPIIATKMRERKMQMQNLRYNWSDVLFGNDNYTTFDDFNEIIMQFCYIMFFSAAFPAAAILSYLNNIIEIKLDANQILNHEPRPAPIRAGGIGVWFNIMETMGFIAIASNAIIFVLTSNSFGAIYYNFCQYTAKKELEGSFSLDPFSIGGQRTLSPTMRTCVNFCSGLYADARYGNPKFSSSPCGGFSSSNQVCTTAALPTSATPLSQTTASTCTPTQPCAVCPTPFLCNPFPLYNGRDYSRAYCNEAPYVNLGSGQWSRSGLSFQIFNPYVDQTLQPSPVTFAQNQDYGAVFCRLGCTKADGTNARAAFSGLIATFNGDSSLPDQDANLCPYSFPANAKEAAFDPTTNEKSVGVPKDYIPYQVLNALAKTASQNIQCSAATPTDPVGTPPVGKPYCFDCSVLSEPQFSANVPQYLPHFIVFNSLNGPNVVGLLWAIFIFEHLVLMIKVFVMALVPDISDDVQELIDGQREYLEKQALEKDRAIAGTMKRDILTKAGPEDVKVAEQQVDAPIESQQELSWNPSGSIVKGTPSDQQLVTVHLASDV